jgi:hypothetical protein
MAHTYGDFNCSTLRILHVQIEYNVIRQCWSENIIDIPLTLFHSYFVPRIVQTGYKYRQL